MDVYCARCGEPWELDYVLHELPKETDLAGKHNTNGRPDNALRAELGAEGWKFGQSLAHVTHCPACKYHRDEDIDNTRAEAYSALADVLGDDLDGFAAEMEDLESWGFF